jgi:MFS family permease
MSIIPSLVNQDKLLAANSLINTTGMIAAALGFGVGGLIISSPLIGLKGGLIIDALTFFISAALIALINIKTEKALMGSMGDNIYTVGTHIEKTFKLLLTDIKDGLGYMFSHRKMHFVIALLFILWSGIGASYVVMIIFIQSSLSSITKDVGLLVMFFGTGLFLGSIAYGKFGHRIAGAKAIFLSLILGGIFLTEFVIFVHIYRSFLLAALIAFLFGGALSPVMISSNTIVHELIPNELRGRVFSSLEAVMHIAFLVFMIVASIIAEYIDPVFILMAVGVVFVYCGIFGIRTMAIREARSG